MYMLGGSEFWTVFKLWSIIISIGSFVFGLTALNGGHHHPESFHDGDAVR